MTTELLGDIEYVKKTFATVDAVIRKLHSQPICDLPEHQRNAEAFGALLRLIHAEPEPCFLLAAVLDFIERMSLSFHHFELWLNQYSGLSFEENFRVRAKIGGKYVDRSDYQAFFPIGGGKVYEGTHFVTAHQSPDLDTTVASFWGWLDAFCARVSDGQHVWNVPGGPPPQIEIDWMFNRPFGASIFTHLAKHFASLNVAAVDLMTQRGMLRRYGTDLIGEIDHNRDENAVVIVDEQGAYLGDWRSADVEGVREVILLLSSCLRWFENHLYLHLMGLFKRQTLKKSDIDALLTALFQLKLSLCEPAQEFSEKQRQKVHLFLASVLGVSQGLECTFEQFSGHLKEAIGTFPFDAKGDLIEERSHIFAFLEETVRSMHEAIVKIRSQLETLDVALKTKIEVFKHRPTNILAHADVEEMRSKMGSHSYLTIVHSDRGNLFPAGIVPAASLRKAILGTVSLRDFCNRDEMGIPSYLEIISVIDHHKSELSTSQPLFAIIGDVQSSNTLVAAQAFLINDRHSLLGQTAEGIEQQISQLSADFSPLATRCMQNLLQRRMIAKRGLKFFIDPQREYLEYLHFLYAIIDDTDLLSKVTPADVECVAELLNRMKSLTSGRICEVVSLDDLPRNRKFAKQAAQRILQNQEMYSLYRKLYALREKEIERNCLSKPSNLFGDTKEQNGCCRVGQTKIFVANVASFTARAADIRRSWLQTAAAVYQEKPEIALHLHMISTIVSAEEVHRGTPAKYAHKDELWLWVPPNEAAMTLLRRFLGAFHQSPGVKSSPFEVELVGPRADEFLPIFEENFASAPRKITPGEESIIVLRFNPGVLNSRKALITPFLPT